MLIKLFPFLFDKICIATSQEQYRTNNQKFETFYHASIPSRNEIIANRENIISPLRNKFLCYISSNLNALDKKNCVISLGGGAFFGLLTGTVAVSFASTIGATLAMLISRFMLRDWAQGCFGKQMETINSGIQKDGGFYLFTLRLLPVVPFFVINLGMGLTPLRTFTFYWVSQLGMLPGTMVYINAGSELAKIEAIGDIFSPTLIGSFVLLGIFPLLVKKFISIIETKRGEANA